MSTILITGSGRRLGRALAIQFAKKGYDLIIHYNNSDELAQKTVKEIQLLGGNATSFKADVRNFDEVKVGFDRIVSKFGYPEILVNNAAIYPIQKSLNQTSPEDWDDVINTNLKGYFNFSKVFAENCQTGSRIINIASMGAFEIWKGRIPYNVSKSGVIQLTKALARDLAPNISVNSVSPGSIEILDEAPAEPLALKVENIPMKRYGTVEDVFDAVYFFANASLYITGQNLNIDGGYHL